MCSMDGTMALAQLSAAELGDPISQDEHSAHLRALYGDAQSEGTRLVESAAIAGLETQRARDAEAASAQAAQRAAAAQAAAQAAATTQAATNGATSASVTAPGELAPAQVRDLQKETRGNDGRRRIMPVPIDAGPAPSALPVGGGFNGTSSPLAPAAAAGAKEGAAAGAPRRLIPQPLPLSAPSSAATASAFAPAAAAGGGSSSSPAVAARFSAAAPLANGGTVVAPPAGGGAPFAAPKRPAGAAGGAIGGAAKKARPAAKSAAATAAAAAPAEDGDRGADPAPLLSAIPAAAAPDGPLACELLPRPADAADATWGGAGGGAAEPPLVLEASVPVPTPRGATHSGSVLACSRRGEAVWTALLPSAATLLTGNASFAAAACADGSLHLFTAAGRRALPALHPCASGISALQADAEHSLLLLGADGAVIVYRYLPQAPTLHARCCALPVLRPLGSDGAGSQATLLHASLLPDGSPLLQLPHGVYTYCASLGAWAALGDEPFLGSEFRGSLPPALSAGPAAPFAAPSSVAALAAVQAQGSARHEPPSAPLLAASLAALPPESARLLSLAHLEHQMGASRLLGNAAEYASRSWFPHRISARLAYDGGRLSHRYLGEVDL